MTKVLFKWILAGASVFPVLVWAGACETNANSLERALDRLCGDRSGPECHSCVELNYLALTREVPQTCKEPGAAVASRRDEWESQHCH